MKFLIPLFAILFHPASYACTYLEGSWTCGTDAANSLKLEFSVDETVLFKQIRMGIAMGPLLIDGNQHSSIDSSRVKMNYVGVCKSDKDMELKVEQIYLGGFKVRFDQNFYLKGKQDLVLEIIDYKAGSSPKTQLLNCSRND